jgi:hypothetical protein
MPGEVKYNIESSLTYAVSDYALMDFVSNDEIANADAPLQPKIYAQDIVMNFLMLAREKRVADVAFASGNYGANTAALSGADRWDVATSDPIQKIEDAIESCFVRPNTMVIGAQVWIKLRNHPKVLQYILSRATTTMGDVPLRVNEQLFAEAFGLDNVVIGRAKYNSAREGASASSDAVAGQLEVAGAALPREGRGEPREGWLRSLPARSRRPRHRRSGRRAAGPRAPGSLLRRSAQAAPGHGRVREVPRGVPEGPVRRRGARSARPGVTLAATQVLPGGTGRHAHERARGPGRVPHACADEVGRARAAGLAGRDAVRAHRVAEAGGQRP